ncbi:hypothetical protein FHX82_005977 [Amycolatopsis bartoniae]|uniref:DUF4873 domain-containing protein n=1 Tax=Amycolatopsis bartoniae TaxID=941986 RepID=A0A8H9M7V2_9PSEU|nr:DUF4873 domain-containing protein [Amycolatopsis bartoniae]MBB2938899.1 hypothetical protein [Amycolatopsis bartoniae]TVS99697.1 DUF4873 domain-containing protein [Amycolatopsis bartoniae]GHF77467.1 DUF4873 domain-containing protein [Amycolatopsis bartoniae]
MSADDEDGYTGPATLVVDGAEFEVRVELRGHFQPIDGYYRWYGRISADPALDELLGGRKKPAEIRTPEGTARGEVSDPDPWGRYRLLGTSTPPFRVPTTLADLTG